MSRTKRNHRKIYKRKTKKYRGGTYPYQVRESIPEQVQDIPPQQQEPIPEQVQEPQPLQQEPILEPPQEPQTQQHTQVIQEDLKQDQEYHKKRYEDYKLFYKLENELTDDFRSKIKTISDEYNSKIEDLRKRFMMKPMTYI